MKPHNVKVVQYFFPESSVKARQDHDPNGISNGTKQKLSLNINEIPSENNMHGVMVRLSSIDDESENLPYSYSIETYGIFEPNDKSTDDLIQDYKSNIKVVSLQILVGAIREHLASITSRGPWATFIAGAVNLSTLESDK